jgi:hypothetical protein
MLGGALGIKPLVDNGVPGPGSYRIPSDFGHYESKKKL